MRNIKLHLVGIPRVTHLLPHLVQRRLLLGDWVDLSPEQRRKIDLLKGKIRAMERQQMGMADRKMVELARLVFRVKNEDEASRVLGLVKVMKAADCVRLRAMKGTLDILNPLQSVHFLALISMFLVQLRKSGKKLDCIRHL